MTRKETKVRSGGGVIELILNSAVWGKKLVESVLSKNWKWEYGSREKSLETTPLSHAESSLK